MTTVNVSRPTDYELLLVGQALQVEGTAAGGGGVEPSQVQTVTVVVDGAPMPAKVGILPGHSPPTVQFTATVSFPELIGLHYVVVDGA